MQSNTSKFKKLTNNTFSLECIRGNIITPLGVECNKTTANHHPTVVVEDLSCLSTISNFIKERSSKHNIERQFINKPEHVIPTILSRSWVAL